MGAPGSLLPGEEATLEKTLPRLKQGRPEEG